MLSSRAFTTAAGLAAGASVAATMALGWRVPDPARMETVPDLVPAPPSTVAGNLVLAVDETYSYGLVVEGVGVRAGPALEADRIDVVFHGDTVAVRCWTGGEELTNGNRSDPTDDETEYRSDRWWRRTTGGYVADVWLGRTGDVTFGLPEC